MNHTSYNINPLTWADENVQYTLQSIVQEMMEQSRMVISNCRCIVDGVGIVLISVWKLKFSSSVLTIVERDG